MPKAPFDADLVVIGSGFGGTLTALTIAHKLHPPSLRAAQKKLKDLLEDDPKEEEPATREQHKQVNDWARQLEDSGELRRIVILERGTWWTTPVPTVQDPKIKTPGFLKGKNQPVQFWSALDHFKGVLDLLTRCLRRRGNEDGLYDFSSMGKTGLFGLLGRDNDGVSVLRASGVGGGSLVYSNITVRPPEFIFDDWDTTWTKPDRDKYFELAKHAIGYSVTLAWGELEKKKEEVNIPYARMPNVAGAVNAGLSNVSTQTARLDPHWETSPDPFLPANSPRSVKRLGADASNWLTRARVFQSAVKAMGSGSYHTVDSSINDLTPERAPAGPPYDQFVPPNHPPDPSGAFLKSVNYCERQGRCTLGCLPGARHTLNKQLMAAAFGKPTDHVPVPQFPNLEILALAEADGVEPSDGGWVVRYFERDPNKPARKRPKTLTAKRVIVAAGCLGTNELLLRSRKCGQLPNLSPCLGEGFSTNGDLIAFLEKTKEPINLTRGPVQTSVAHFNDQPGDDNSRFHIVEDQGIPKALSVPVGFGVPLIQALSRQSRLALLWNLFKAIIKRGFRDLGAPLRNARQREEFFQSEEETTMNMMCVTASGRARVKGKFRLGDGRRESSLRVASMDKSKHSKVQFHKDPIFRAIYDTLNKKGGLADQLLPEDQRALPKDQRGFKIPFAAESVTTTHPLGGCQIGKDATRGVVDESGRVFDASGPGKYYTGLYVADASIVPTALGVNPSLTISALALSIGEGIATEMRQELEAGRRG